MPHFAAKSRCWNGVQPCDRTLNRSRPNFTLPAGGAATAGDCASAAAPVASSERRLTPSDTFDLWMRPLFAVCRFAVGTAQHAVGFFVALYHLLFRVPGERASELHRHIRQNAARGRNVAFL